WERQQRALAAEDVCALVRPELLDLCKLAYPTMPINDIGLLQGAGLVFVNARWLAPAKVLIDGSRAHVGLVDGQVAFVAAPSLDGSDLAPENLASWLDDWRHTLPAVEAGGAMIDFLWDLVDFNAETLVMDWDWFRQARAGRAQHTGIGLI